MYDEQTQTHSYHTIPSSFYRYRCKQSYFICKDSKLEIFLTFSNQTVNGRVVLGNFLIKKLFTDSM